MRATADLPAPPAPGPLDARERAVAQALARHGEGVARLARRLLGDDDAARDVAQEAFVRLVDHLDAAGPDPGPWLRTVAARLALDRLRRGAREARLLPDVARDPRRAPASPPPGGGPEAAEARALVLAALERLPARQREVVLLRVVAEEPWAALAAGLGVSEGTAKTHLRRALEALRAALGPVLGPAPGPALGGASGSAPSPGPAPAGQAHAPRPTPTEVHPA